MPAQSPGPSVAFQNVRVSYGATLAVDEVTVEIGGGSFVALVGGSGSGKTTLVKTINRLVEPSAGAVTIDGACVAMGDPHRLRRRIGHVFQNVGLFPHLTVGQNVAIGARIAGERMAAERVIELLELVELAPDLAARMPDQLSGGQRQRVGVARALALQPRLMLMDEPFGALDPVTRDALGRTIRGLHDRLGLTTIMVTHDMAEALLLADRVLVMAAGRIVADAAPAALLAGEGGDVATALVAVPRDQARRLAALEGWAVNAAWARVPDLLASHVLISAAALLLGLALAIPLTILSTRSPLFARAALGLAALVQTIPGLALLALFFPILIALGLPALGFLPSLCALGLYALLPILRNAVTGLAGLDPAIIEAADGVGMTRWQRLAIVEAPLVAPVLMAGVRTAAVWTIGAATLSTTVGQPSLGDIIFAGLQTQNWSLVLAGCVAAAALAFVVDGLLGLAERGIATRRRWMWAAALLLLAAGAAAALAPRIGARRDTVVVGAKGFSEQYILARLVRDRLEAAGYRVELREGLGSGVQFGALATNGVDLSIDYTGTVWTNEMRRKDTPPPAAMLAEVGRWARTTHGVKLLGGLGFENAYALAMRGEAARARGVRTLADLARVAPTLRFGTDPEFQERPEWAAVRDAYGIRFAGTRTYQPTFMYRALASGEVDVISAYTSDGRIAADGLTVLQDPRHAFPNYATILMVSPARAADARFAAALRPLIGRVPVEAMREANYMVDRDQRKVSPDEAARWLAKRIGI